MAQRHIVLARSRHGKRRQFFFEFDLIEIQIAHQAHGYTGNLKIPTVFVLAFHFF